MIRRLQIEGLTLQRGERRLCEGLDFTLEAGEAVALTGVNGAGKTSLLRAIAGLLQPAAGVIRFIGDAGEFDADDARRGGMHLLGHLDGLKSTRTAREELTFQARWTGADENSIQAAIQRLELSPLLDLEVRMLSAGQRRRLALLRLVASRRSLWLLDEPLAPLDAARRRAFAELMADHLAGGGMVLAAVHDPLPGAGRALELGA